MVSSQHRVAKDTEAHRSIFRGMVARRTQQCISIMYFPIHYCPDCIHCSTGCIESSLKRAATERCIKLYFTPCPFSRSLTLAKGTNTCDILPGMVDGQFIFACGTGRNELHLRGQA